MATETFIPTPFDLPVSNALNVDEAVEIIFKRFGWPLLGGPSGRGWSMVSTAQKCGQLFYATCDAPVARLVRDKKTRAPFAPAPLQIGSLYHTLQALYYAAGLGGGDGAVVLPNRGGLVCPSLFANGSRKRTKLWKVPATAADDLLDALKAMCNQPGEDVAAPNLSIVLEAQRVFDAHTERWGNGQEDLIPLGVEVYAEHAELDYTCRYDFIGKAGPHEAHIPQGVCILERKTTAWLSEAQLEGWTLDGEVLGELLCWEPSGMTNLFGPLSSLVVDLVTKGKIPDVRRVILPPKLPAVENHARWVRWTHAQIHAWRATGVYPQNFASCYGRYGRCSQFDKCAMGLTREE